MPATWRDGPVCGSDRHMPRWPRLNDRQLAVLRRIAAGQDAVTSREPTLATTVYALRGRRLVETPRRAGVWTAVMTAAARYYLQHGRYADSSPVTANPSARHPIGPGASGDDGASRDVSAMPAPVDLIDKLRAAGGTLRVTSPEPATRAAWCRVIHAAKEAGLVPEGHHLRHHGRDRGDLLIELSPGEHPGQLYWTQPRHRIELPDADASVHPIIQALAEDERRLRVTSGSRSRAHHLIHALVAATEQRGHTAQLPQTSDVPGMCIVVGRWTYRLVIEEEWDTIRRWSEIDEPGSATYAWQRVRPADESCRPDGSC